MLFAFEKLELGIEDNFIDCPDVNTSGIRRFGPCPFTSRLIRNARCKDTYENLDISSYAAPRVTPDISKYIISAGVNHSPDDWCGIPVGTNRKNVFDCLSEKYLADLKSGNAILLLDQSHEGYQTTWLWKWFHESLKERGISPESVIYVTGNLLAEKQYDLWCIENSMDKVMLVLPYTHFEHMIYETGINRVRFDGLQPLPTVNDHIQYKQSASDIKDYNFLQKRLRSHRAWGYKAFHDADLLPHGLLSMNNFDYMKTHMEGRHITEHDTEIINKTLPADVYGVSNTLHPDIYYINRFNEDVMLDSWISVVSEASFSDIDNTCFLSEKSFKPIACHHPFMVFGNKHSLQFLKDLGYKTFHPFIDETYDELTTWDRLNAITASLKKFHEVTDKLEWYKSISPILRHNYEVLYENSVKKLPDVVVKFDKYCRNYFNVRPSV